MEAKKGETDTQARKTVANTANDQEKDKQRFTKSGTTKRVLRDRRAKERGIDRGKHVLQTSASF